MIATFLAAEGEYSGRYNRDEGDDPDPWAVWIVRAFTAALAVFWSVVLWQAAGLLP